ncbi:pilus assembly protein TadG-related protein [Actinocrinis sp.]|uniref:pilus assembly protein TadG-related protein n=1 Tax=Actinocrinis sp. TaxID=1920516 RepID=UPI002D2E795A|nr:pilus assembly protein TadG-related protein [Actinocrinis sp.]HZP50278.1 pilus assembly protein TadG-related protein [Actinocrinis sp.]
MRARFGIRKPIRRRPSGERGSFTFAVIFWALMAMMLAGLVVDGGLALTERQRAGDIAEQAARAAANDLDQNALRNGQYVLAGDACQRAELVGSAAGGAKAVVTCGAVGSLTLPNGLVVPTMTVNVEITYDPILLGMVMKGPVFANASATAHPQPGP